MDSPLVRHPANPILTAEASGRFSSVEEAGVLVFNPGVTRSGGGFVMAYRCDYGTPGDPNIVGSSIRFADSVDGIDWRPRAGTGLDRDAAIDLLGHLEPHRDLGAELWRIYDPRLHRLATIDGPQYALTFAADTTAGLRGGLALGRDGVRWQVVSLGAPDSRNHVLFPEQVGGTWWRLERPMQEYGGEAMGAGRYGIWASRSPDLQHWGSTRLAVSVDDICATAVKIGPGTPPVRTSAGWLCLVHVVHELGEYRQRGWEPMWDKRYDAWSLLLDADDPSKLVAARGPVLSADPSYERTGYRNDVIFPTAAIVADKHGVDELWVYYGAADTCIGLATAPLEDLVTWTLAAPQ